ncbi:hypothetical protein [Rhodococcus sovatensis]|uniref:Uncharacterized protein n=1 Tax=Rhodococcus sovatensis TaxID=1805840 RepID=A0ABZ2PH50_9NOCA
MGGSTIDDGSYQGGGRRRWCASNGMAAIGVGLGILLLVGVLVRFWVLILAVVIIAIAVWLIHDSRMQRQVRHDLEEQRRADLRSRADAEHQAFLRGERRGLYGEYDPPEV